MNAPISPETGTRTVNPGAGANNPPCAWSYAAEPASDIRQTRDGHASATHVAGGDAGQTGTGGEQGGREAASPRGLRDAVVGGGLLSTVGPSLADVYAALRAFLWKEPHGARAFAMALDRRQFRVPPEHARAVCWLRDALDFTAPEHLAGESAAVRECEYPDCGVAGPAEAMVRHPDGSWSCRWHAHVLAMDAACSDTASRNPSCAYGHTGPFVRGPLEYLPGSDADATGEGWLGAALTLVCAACRSPVGEDVARAVIHGASGAPAADAPDWPTSELAIAINAAITKAVRTAQSHRRLRSPDGDTTIACAVMDLALMVARLSVPIPEPEPDPVPAAPAFPALRAIPGGAR